MEAGPGRRASAGAGHAAPVAAVTADGGGVWLTFRPIGARC